MKTNYEFTDFEWLYPSRALDLLQRRHELSRIIRTYSPIPDADFQPYMIEQPKGWIIALQDGQIAAIVHLELFKRSASAHIIVTETFRRSNLAKLMADNAIDYAFNFSGKAKMFADIGINNKIAQRFASALGFLRIAVYDKRIKYCLRRQDVSHEFRKTKETTDAEDTSIALQHA